jgi:hypothetical protein
LISSFHLWSVCMGGMCSCMFPFWDVLIHSLTFLVLSCFSTRSNIPGASTFWVIVHFLYRRHWSDLRCIDLFTLGNVSETTRCTVHDKQFQLGKSVPFLQSQIK